jgi:DNA-binding transcriptional LysR family regulator
MWADIDLRELRVFLAIADQLHFARAAEQLGITASRASQSLRTLEAKLGVRLVQRTSRRVTLTVAGDRLYRELAPAHDRLAQVLQSAMATPAHLSGAVRLGLRLAASGGPRLTEVLAAFDRAHPQCRVEISELPFRDRFEPLRRGEIDAMAIRLPFDEPDVAVGPTLSIDERVLCLRHDHPLAARDAVTTEDIADYRVINADMVPRDLAEALIPSTSAGGRPIPRLTAPVESTSELLVLVARGVVVHPTVRPFAEHTGHPDIVFRPITDLPPSRSVLVWRQHNADPRLRAFAAVARTVLGS